MNRIRNILGLKRCRRCKTNVTASADRICAACR